MGGKENDLVVFGPIFTCEVVVLGVWGVFKQKTIQGLLHPAVSKSPFPTYPIASVHVSSKFFGHTMSLMSHDRFGNLPFSTCLLMSFHHLVSCPGADEGKALPLSNPVRNQGCQSVQKHVATRYTPYHPWDDCIFTYIWLIFYGRCRQIYQSHGW